MPIQSDAVIIGAGPCGLFQVFELGLLDISAHVIDALPQVGGQCSELYPDKPIYDIPALPVVGAQELIDRLLEQIKPFAPQFHLEQTVTTFERLENGNFLLETSAGTRFETPNVIVAAGLGAFQPRRLKGAEPWEGMSVHYRVEDPAAVEGKDILILGGGDSALDWLLELQPRARSITLIHRRPEYRAAPASVKKMKTWVEAGKLSECQGTVRDILSDDGVFRGVRIRGTGSDGQAELQDIRADAAYVFYGLSPNLGPIADWGLEIERRQLPVDTERFQTSEPGVFAVGDINTYPGKKKLILSGFHEAALAAFAVKERLTPDKKVHLQYTTTSPIMHKRLGVEG